MTERFNRSIIRFGSHCPALLRTWFCLGAVVSSLLILPSIYLLVSGILYHLQDNYMYWGTVPNFRVSYCRISVVLYAVVKYSELTFSCSIGNLIKVGNDDFFSFTFHTIMMWRSSARCTVHKCSDERNYKIAIFVKLLGFFSSNELWHLRAFSYRPWWVSCAATAEQRTGWSYSPFYRGSTSPHRNWDTISSGHLLMKTLASP